MFRIFSSAAWMRHAVALAIAVVAAGCSDSTAPQKSANGGGGNANNGGGGGTVASGTYSLRAIDRKALPYEIHHGPFFDPTSRHFYNQLVVKITKGAIELGPLGDCAIWLDYTLNEDGQVSTKHIETDGSWKMVGNQVTVYVNGNPTAQFTIQNGQVVENADVIPDGTMHEYTFQK